MRNTAFRLARGLTIFTILLAPVLAQERSQVIRYGDLDRLPPRVLALGRGSDPTPRRSAERAYMRRIADRDTGLVVRMVKTEKLAPVPPSPRARVPVETPSSVVRPVTSGRTIRLASEPQLFVVAGTILPTEVTKHDYSYTKSFGNDWAGGSFEASFKAYPAKANNGTAEVRAETSMKAKILKQSIPVFTARLAGSDPGGSEMLIRVGTWDLVNQTGQQIQKSYQKSFTLGPYGVNIWIVRLEVNLGVQFGFTAAIEMRKAGADQHEFGLALSASIFGSASAGLSIVVAGVDLVGELHLLSPKITSGMVLGAYGALGGKGDICFDPVKLVLKVRAWIGLKFWLLNLTYSKSWTLVEWTAGSYCKNIFKF